MASFALIIISNSFPIGMFEKTNLILVKNALKGHNLVLFGSFSLPIQDFFGATITPNRTCFFSLKTLTG